MITFQKSTSYLGIIKRNVNCCTTIIIKTCRLMRKRWKSWFYSRGYAASILKVSTRQCDIRTWARTLPNQKKKQVHQKHQQNKRINYKTKKSFTNFMMLWLQKTSETHLSKQILVKHLGVRFPSPPNLIGYRDRAIYNAFMHSYH